MSKGQVVNWGKWTAIGALILIAPVVMGYARKAFDVADTPAREAALEARVGVIETNCSSNFISIHDDLDEIKHALKLK